MSLDVLHMCLCLCVSCHVHVWCCPPLSILSRPPSYGLQCVHNELAEAQLQKAAATQALQRTTQDTKEALEAPQLQIRASEEALSAVRLDVQALRSKLENPQVQLQM